jgi:urease accessory protein
VRRFTRHQHRWPAAHLAEPVPKATAYANVLVHPPGGLVGGDTLNINITARGSSHGLTGLGYAFITGYELAQQRTHIQRHDEFPPGMAARKPFATTAVWLRTTAR